MPLKRSRTGDFLFNVKDHALYANFVFQYYDKDHNGSIDSQEFVQLIFHLFVLRDGSLPNNAFDIAWNVSSSLRCVRQSLETQQSQQQQSLNSITFSDFLDAVLEQPSPFDHPSTGEAGLRTSLLLQGEKLYVIASTNALYPETQVVNDVLRIFESYDSDRSGSIDYNEFITLVSDLFIIRDGQIPQNMNTQ